MRRRRSGRTARGEGDNVTIGGLVVLSGRVDASSVSAYRSSLHAAVETGVGPLVIDLAAVDIIDATGLGMLVGTQQRAEQAGRRLLLRDVPPRVARLLRLTHLDRVLHEEPAAAAVG